LRRGLRLVPERARTGAVPVPNLPGGPGLVPASARAVARFASRGLIVPLVPAPARTVDDGEDTEP